MRLRDILPRGLYARSLLLLLAPLLLILGLMTWYYYTSHIAEVNRKLAQAIARDVRLVQAMCAEQPVQNARLVRLSEALDMEIFCEVAADTGGRAAKTPIAYGDALTGELTTQLGVPVRLGLNPSESLLTIRFPHGTKTVQVMFERKRALTINSHFFIVWVILSSLLMTGLAIGFLNQQVRSILRLSEAARAFGRGRELAGFRPTGATEVRNAARALIDMKSRLTAFTEQRTAMLAGVSHDLRTPLTRLKLALAMMPQTDDLKAAQSDLDDMAMMLEEYLAFARGADEGEPVPTDLAALLREVAAGFGPHVAVSGPDKVMVVARPLAIKRAVTNLVSNAVKFAAVLQVTLTVSARYAEIIVDDDGPGIPAGQREEAFRAFSRLDEARSQNTPGTGLGLTLARDTARAHGGDVRLADSPLGGLRAVLRLPV
jgi:two-component system, OmpR family, osmolarity sensor histidine kinase EnvZ